MISPEDVLEHLRQRVPYFEVTGRPEPLQGGYLNYVWRVRGRPAPLIVKVAPPYVAALPQVPLDTHRAVIEARSLAALEPKGLLATVATHRVRPPRLIDFDESRHILIMEDVSNCLDLGTWLRQGGQSVKAGEEVGCLLGEFIGGLHVRSFNDDNLATTFDNRGIQQTRLVRHYGAIRDLCRRAGLSDADELGRTAISLGELLLGPGRCVIMGDLWPPSILLAPEGIRIIDWELAHFGYPSQDVGHLLAHLWMHIHRAPTAEVAATVRALLKGFLVAYRQALGTSFGDLFGPDGIRQSATHFGAEVLVRVIGAYQRGYLYDGLSLNDSNVREAVQVGAAHIRNPERSETFAALLT